MPGITTVDIDSALKITDWKGDNGLTVHYTMGKAKRQLRLPRILFLETLRKRGFISAYEVINGEYMVTFPDHSRMWFDNYVFWNFHKHVRRFTILHEFFMDVHSAYKLSKGAMESAMLNQSKVQ
jgi:hypothetical protein